MEPIPFARKSRIPGHNVLEDSAMDPRAEFLDAMKKKNPRLYAFLARTNPGLLHVPGHAAGHVADLGATAATTQPQPSWWQSMLTSIGQAIPMGITAYQEVALARAQVHNAVQGKPPIPVQNYVAASPPTATVQVGVNPNTQKTVLYVAAGIGVLVLFSMMNKSGALGAKKAAR